MNIANVRTVGQSPLNSRVNLTFSSFEEERVRQLKEIEHLKNELKEIKIKTKFNDLNESYIADNTRTAEPIDIIGTQNNSNEYRLVKKETLREDSASQQNDLEEIKKYRISVLKEQEDSAVSKLKRAYEALKVENVNIKNYTEEKIKTKRELNNNNNKKYNNNKNTHNPLPLSFDTCRSYCMHAKYLDLSLHSR